MERELRHIILDSPPDPSRPWQRMAALLLEGVSNSIYLMDIGKTEMAYLLLSKIKEGAESMYLKAGEEKPNA